jgi:membrane protein implicated in regulation of membrane protease activity
MGRYLLGVQFVALIIGIVLLFLSSWWRALGAFMLVVSVAVMYASILIQRRRRDA